MKWNIALLLIGAITGAILGIFLTLNLAAPREVIRWQTQTILQMVPQVEYRDVVRTVTIQKEVPLTVFQEVYVPRPLKFFASVEELRAWLDKEPYYLPSYDGFDCDDYARFLQLDAIRDGFQMSTELDYLYGQLHMLNSVIIGSELYFIEPQDHTCWLRCNLD